ncbi:MAG: tRNA (adenosine(37)-N6)-threonylcarbamoyltransferase complex transferase subunit TsaD [Planctomycetota bacterium]
MLILGIETSCDETAASVVENGKKILSNIVLSQVKLHEHFSGVVPEIACRAHSNWITKVLEKATIESNIQINDLDAIAVTTRPGLIGALLIGLCAAKSLSYALSVPLIAVDHLQAHLYAAVMHCKELEFPFTGLVASGGHTSLFYCTAPGKSKLIGSTTDDAVGESFDKVSKILGLGYPGGPAISKHAQRGNPKAVRFPRSLLSEDSLDFSFSGIKTAVYYYVNGQPGKKKKEIVKKASTNDICASFQEAVVDVLVEKVMRASKITGTKQIAITGGVASNNRLREKISAAAEKKKKEIFFPAPELCTDNATMVAGLAYHQLMRGEKAELNEDAFAQAHYEQYKPDTTKHKR